MKQFFIDKFTIPKSAREEFVQRMNLNRNFIKNLPDFIQDTVYERSDENGNIIALTIAVWENEEAIKKAKEAVQKEYKRIGFNPEEMLTRLNILMDREIYKEMT